MKCSVPDCPQKVTTSVGKNDEFHFCKEHWLRWGDFRAGYYDGHYGNYERHGRLNRKLWDAAMPAFIDHCRVEIVALKQLGISKDASLEEAYGAIERR